MPYQPFRGLPGGPVASVLNSRGKLRLVSFDSPGAADIVIKCPGNTLWRLNSITFTTTGDPAEPHAENTVIYLQDPNGVTYAAFIALGAGEPATTLLTSFTTPTAALPPFNPMQAGGLGDFAYVVPGGTVRVSFLVSVIPPVFSSGLMLVEEWLLS